MTKILLIEDDPLILELTKVHLEDEGFEVLEAQSGEAGLATMKSDPPDLVVLDIRLPGMDGFETCRRIRELRKGSTFRDKTIGNTPIIMLTARVLIEDRLTGLDLGADDYMTKPFEPDELVARIRAILRRTAPADVSSKIICGALEVRSADHIALLEGNPLELSPTEFDFLEFLAKHPNQAFSRTDLLTEVWGYKYTSDTRTVDAYVNRLRKKLNKQIEPSVAIVTIRNVGYKLEVG